MNWTAAIDINRAALVRIVAGLMALVDGYRGSPWIPVKVHRAVVRILRPAESAVRRLILISARKVTIAVAAVSKAPPSKRPHAVALRRKSEKQRRPPFRLFDPRRGFVDFPEAAPPSAPAKLPRITMIDHDPRVPEFLRQPPPPSAKPGAPDGMISVRKISRRLSAVTFALHDISRQAKRLLRRLGAQTPENRRSVLRPGPAPGAVKRPRDEIHFVLKECHALARYVLSENTS